MIAAVVVAAFVIVAFAALWARYARTQSERQSVRNYERALGRLGDVARRSDAVADVRSPKPGELARPHVQPSRPGLGPNRRPGPPPSRRPLPPEAVPRIRLSPPGAPPEGEPTDLAAGTGLDDPAGRQDAAALDMTPPAEKTLRAGSPTRGSRAGGPRARAVGSGPQRRRTKPAAGDAPRPYGPELPGDATGVEAAATGARRRAPLAPPIPTPRASTVFDDAGEPLAHGSAIGRFPRGIAPPTGRELVVRRAAAGAAAAVALGAVVAGGVVLVTGGKKGPAGSVGHPTTTSNAATTTSTPTPPASIPGGTTASGALLPTSATKTLVAYTAPSKTYTLSFHAGAGAVWIGVQRTLGGAYLWMATISPGSSASYRATGAVAVRVGAPPYCTMTINGTALSLPSINTQPYDVTFTP